MLNKLIRLLWVIASCSAAAFAQFISADTYTRYELLAPETHQFKIYYEVTETRAGARFHFNAIREGSEASNESVIDLATGKPLKFEVVSGAQVKSDVPGENFSPTGKYIKVHLAHPVPDRGEYRLAIIKTYKDDKSYYSEGDQIVFKRSLSIPRNSVVLPLGYEVISCSVATQVLMETDGRLKLAFVNAGSGGSLEVTIKARKIARRKEPGACARTRAVRVFSLFSLTSCFRSLSGKVPEGRNVYRYESNLPAHVWATEQHFAPIGA